jgi:hypothetical protein
MSSVIVEGNISGTGSVTIAAPNTNSDFTVTLPTGSGELVSTGGAQTIQFAAGSASTPSITTTGDTNTGIFFPAADTIAFAEGGAEAMRIDSSGNVGIGTSSLDAKFQVSASSKAMLIGTASTMTEIFPSFLTGQSNIPLEISSNGTSGNGGASLVLSNAQTGSGAQTGGINFAASGTSGTEKRSALINSNLTADSSSSVSGDLKFWTTSTGTITERARITSGGYFKASNSGSYLSTTSTYHEFNQNLIDNICLYVRNSASLRPSGMFIAFTGATPNNTSEYFLYCQDSTNDKCVIYSNGTVTNRTGTYNSFSDLKLKQDIVDANSQWDDIKALRVVKYRLKDEVAADPNYPAYIGLIAQEVEQVSAGLVDDCPDFENVEVPVLDDEGNPVLDEEGNPQVTTERQPTGTVTKSVKYSILYMKAVKALQEAMERIETLEAKNDALEARIAALEGAK